MLLDAIVKGTTDYSVTIRIVDSTDGTPETGVVFNTAGIDLWYRRPGAAHTSITEVTQTEGGAHTDGGFVHISDGYYRLDLPDAAAATGVDYFDVGGTVTGMVVIGGRVRLTDMDLDTSLPSNFADLSITATTGRVDVDSIAGTSQTANDNGNDINVLLTRIVGTLAAGTHTAQTGDAYAIVNNGTYGNSAIETLVDELETRLSATRAGYLDELAAANIPADIDTLLSRLVGTIAAGTHTAQTGDSFARIGANGAGLTDLASASALATVDANVDTMVAGIITGAAATGTLSTTQATTDLTGYTADQLIGRLITWTSGACDGEQTDITDYEVTNGRLTFTALTLSPGNGDTFKIT